VRREQLGPGDQASARFSILAAHRDQGEIVAAGVPELPRRGALDHHHGARAALEALAVDLEARLAALHDVDLILAGVVVGGLLGGRRQDKAAMPNTLRPSAPRRSR
jgi:hypothetical protein